MTSQSSRYQLVTAGRVLKFVAALALLVGGLVHLQLYFAAYRSYPDANLGRSFIVNAIVSTCVAAALLVRRERWVRLLGISIAAGTLLAFAVTRSSDLLFGFEEKGLQPSPQAAVALTVEIAAIVLLAATFIPRVEREDAELNSSFVPAIFVPAIAVVALVFVGFGVYWARDYGTKTVTTAPATVTTAPIPTSAPTATNAATTTTSGSSGPVASQPTPATTSAPASSTTTIAVPVPSQNEQVSIVDFEFKADAVTVPRGTPVTWTNLDSFDHSVVGANDSFRSESLDTGSAFEHTFDVAGEFAYICGIHPSMSGVITVTD